MEENVRQERTSKSMIGMPVLSIAEGQPLGQIKQILIDVKNKAVQAFVLERRRFSRDERILPFAAISGFGEDTITIEKYSLLERKGQSYQYVRALRQPLPLIGARVFTAGGRTLGKVEEYRFSLKDGSITGLEIAGDGLFKNRTLVDGQYIIAVAAHTVMIKDQAIEAAVALENPFLTNMESAADTMREAATVIKDNAVVAGKRLAENFNEAVDKLWGREGEQEEEEPEAAAVKAESIREAPPASGQAPQHCPPEPEDLSAAQPAEPAPADLTPQPESKPEQSAAEDRQA